MNVLLSKGTSRTLGVIGGLGSLACGDLFLKLIRSRAVLADQGRYHLLFEQHPFNDIEMSLDEQASMTSRKLYVFQACEAYGQAGADAVLIPCFASHTFLNELRSELDVPIVDIMEAIKLYLRNVIPAGSRLGILASDYVKSSGLFERCLGDEFKIIYPSEISQVALMQAVYGQAGIKTGHLDGVAVDLVHQVSLHLKQEGADIILPGMTELSLVAQELERRGVSCVDVNSVYAEFASSNDFVEAIPRFKLGVVGGVGPAATVDFIGKLVKNTPAGRDQDHIKIVVEQNPQIPDRTANLLHKQTDPTVAMYSTCKRLERDGAAAIAIPCNTAHAFVERIQGHLKIPIINMLTETVRHIKRCYGSATKVGLLATSGTIQSGVYHQAAEQVGFTLLVPDVSYQKLVMDAIYGKHGVKAGFTTGQCRQEFLSAAEHLVRQGVTVIILGCTELPLIIPQSEGYDVAGVRVDFVDPTNILALRCVALAKESDDLVTKGLGDIGYAEI